MKRRGNNACPAQLGETMNCKMLCRSTLLLLALILTSTETIQAKTPSSKEHVIAEVTRLGGKLEFDETLTARPIVKVDLHGTAVVDSDLAFLAAAKKDLKSLRYLDLRLTKIGDAGIAKLKNLTSLQTLNLFRTQLGDEGLAHLKKLSNLETLLIGGTKVTDAGLVYLRPFRKLRKLSLFQTQVSDDGIPQLKLIGSLEVLLISGSKITPAGAEELQKALPKVRFSENT
jgi:Leucine-rich repeat (LRR) protein